MAMITQCSSCSKQVSASVNDFHPLCEDCKRRHGWKSWEEMTPEQKVEDLNKRLRAVEAHNTLLG